jgi:membrane protein implicated in regulation of membrane protease activity
METLGASPATHGWYHHVVVATPAVVGVVVAAVAGTIAALATTASGMASLPSIAIGIATFLSVAIVLALYQRRAFTARRTLRTARFPSPATGRVPHHH